MWAPVAQPQPQHVHPLPEWLADEVLESVSQGYNGGNVMVDEASYSFSPFTVTDCTLFSHFSFQDFVALAFLDLAKDLDAQI